MESDEWKLEVILFNYFFLEKLGNLQNLKLIC